MSFIVKGLDMPKQGEILRIEVDYDGTVWWDDGRKYHELEDSAIQIPKGHGRLIDGDGLIRELSVITDRPIRSGMYIIREATTILEEEE